MSEFFVILGAIGFTSAALGLFERDAERRIVEVAGGGLTCLLAFIGYLVLRLFACGGGR